MGDINFVKDINILKLKGIRELRFLFLGGTIILGRSGIDWYIIGQCSSGHGDDYYLMVLYKLISN